MSFKLPTESLFNTLQRYKEETYITVASLGAKNTTPAKIICALSNITLHGKKAVFVQG